MNTHKEREKNRQSGRQAEIDRETGRDRETETGGNWEAMTGSPQLWATLGYI